MTESRFKKETNWNNGLDLARCHLTRRNLRPSSQLQDKKDNSSHENRTKSSYMSTESKAKV